MKKNLLALVAVVFCLNACSYFSWMNPWADKNDVKKEQIVLPNVFLWEASLQKLGFVSFQEKNREKGLLVTKWFKMDGHPEEMFMVKVEVLTADLRSDGLRVSVDKRVSEGNGWHDVQKANLLSAAIADRILRRARDLYRQDMYRRNQY